ncbi:MAG: TMEM165/GDT1 family protein [Methylocystaceae bacterium]
MGGLLITLSTYVLIILAELGDKTQLATLMLASNNPAKRWLIFSSAGLALCSCVLVEVSAGRWLAQHIGIGTINRFTGVLFIIIGVVIISRLVWDYIKHRSRVNRPLQLEDAA